MRTIVFDLYDAARGLRRDRAYAATVILTLAVTIGAAAAVFSIIDGVLLKPLSYPESDRLVTIREVWHEFKDRAPSLPLNAQHFEHWRSHAQSFASAAQYLPLAANLTGAGDAMQISVLHSSGSLFDVLGVRAALGRTLSVEDERKDRPDVALLGHALWRRQFAAATSIIGESIVLDGKPFTVVGVLPAGFQVPTGDRLISTIEVVIPLRVDVGWIGDHNNFGVARLHRHATIDQARAEIDVLQKQVSAIASQRSKEQVTLSAVLTPLAESIVGGARRGLLLLFAAVAAVMLIACSNLANLSLSRALGRLRDGAIRTALGASRSRLIAHAVFEQVTLSGAGAVVGIAVAWAALRIFVRTAPVDLPRVNEVALDGRVLAFAAGVALLAGLLVSILPAWRVASRDVQTALRSGSASVGIDRGGMRARSALMALQIALSVVLIVVTSLLGASFRRVLNVERGFSADGVLVVPVALPAARYSTEPLRVAVYDRILSTIRALPAVKSVTLTSLLPLGGEGQVNFIVADGTNVPRSEQPSANFRLVAPEFFDTLEISLRGGRSFTNDERDPLRPAPVVISEPVAQRLWPGQDPIGKRLSRGIPNEQGFEVVGVAVDARTTSLERTPPLMLYVPYWWRSRAGTSLLIKTTVDPMMVTQAIGRAIREIDADIAVGGMRRFEELVDAATAGRRYQAGLFSAFGSIALFIACLGVYAVTSYSLSRRRREMNIRVALGARKSAVLMMVVKQTALPIVAGVGAGVIGALAMGGAIASLLYEVRPGDPLIMAAVVSLIAGIALTTTVIAARQGMSINPVAALRDE